MTDAYTLAGWFSAALTAVAVLYSFFAGLCVRRSAFSSPDARAEHAPGVTLLKPLSGDEPGLEANLRSFFEQDYDGAIQIVFGAHNPSDPALKTVERLQEKYPGRDIQLVVNPHIVGLNPKAANLANMLPHARHDILIASDSDIRVPAGYVRTLVAELEQPNVGAVTCLYRGESRGNLWAELESMSIDYQFFPNAVAGTSMRLARPCFGSTIALKRTTLVDIGGFGAVAEHLADDYEMGRAIREKGYDVKLSSLVVTHVCSESTSIDLFRHELRWAKTIRLLNPWGYTGSVITHPFPLALVAAWLTVSPLQGFVLVAAALSARLWVVWRVRSVVGSQAGPLWLLPVRDMMSFAIYFTSFFGNSIYWRGNRYLTGADGVLAQR